MFSCDCSRCTCAFGRDPRAVHDADWKSSFSVIQDEQARNVWKASLRVFWKTCYPFHSCCIHFLQVCWHSMDEGVFFWMYPWLWRDFSSSSGFFTKSLLHDSDYFLHWNVQ